MEEDEEEYIDEEELDNFFKTTKMILDATECSDYLKSIKVDPDKLYEQIKDVVGEEGFAVLDDSETMQETAKRYIITFAVYEREKKLYRAYEKKLKK